MASQSMQAEERMHTLPKEESCCTHEGFTAAPLAKSQLYLCGIHRYASDLSRQIIAHHFCRHLPGGIHQCLIFDSDAPNARCIGVEFVIPRKMFETLPPEEKMMWHSHVAEVKEGILSSPGLSEDKENKIMNELIDTYGKTIHFWQVDRGDELPIGLPQIMTIVDSASEIQPKLAQELERINKAPVSRKQELRKDIKMPTPNTEADVYKQGIMLELCLKQKRE